MSFLLNRLKDRSILLNISCLIIFIISIYIYCNGFLSRRSIIPKRSRSPRYENGSASIMLRDDISSLIKERNVEYDDCRKSRAIEDVVGSFGKGPFKWIRAYDSRSGKVHQINASRFPSNPEHPWLPFRFHSTIVLLIDALRYDFMLHSDDFCNTSPSHFHQYHFKLDILQKLRAENPSSYIDAIFISDPPTTSQQRVNSINSGTLPNYLEAAFNFADFESLQDNLMIQYESAFGKNGIYFFGDSTWSGLFPSILKGNKSDVTSEYYAECHGKYSDNPFLLEILCQKRVFDEYSFHVYDLHTVDNNIKRRLFPLLNETLLNGNRPPIIICHFLGVDHCGHTYGPRSSFMESLLYDTNYLLEETSKLLDETGLLIVFGDHGMTEDGDHGGNTAKEISPGIFFHSKNISVNLIESYRRLIGYYEDNPVKELLLEEYNSLETFYGSVQTIRNGVIGTDYDLDGLNSFVPNLSQKKVISQVDYSVTVSLLTGTPIPYSSIGMIFHELFFVVDPIDLIPHLDHAISGSNAGAFSHSTGDLSTIRRTLMEVKRQNFEFLIRALRLNALQIIRYYLSLAQVSQKGFLFSFVLDSFYSSFCSIDSLLLDSLSNTEGNVSTTQIKHLESSILEYTHLISNMTKFGRESWAKQDESLMYWGIATGILLLLLFVVFVKIKNWPFILMVIFYLASHFSNSFIVFEDSLVRFFLSLIAIVLFYENHCLANFSVSQITKKSAPLIFFLLIVRISHISGSCREEQTSFCRYISHRDYPLSRHSVFAIIPSFIIASLLFFITTSGFCQSFPVNLYSKCKFFISMAFVFAKWMLTILHESYSAEIKSLELFCPKIVYIFTVVSILEAMVSGLFSSKDQHSDKNRAGNFLIIFLPLVMILLRPFQGFFTFLIFHWEFFFFRALLKGNSKLDADETVSLFKYFTGIQLFFTSGHQYTITSIQWESAFCGAESIPQFMSAVFVLINTFGPSCLPFLMTHPGETRDDEGNGHLSIRSCCNKICWPSLLLVFDCVVMMVVCLVQSRHLMLWAVFTPRFLISIMFVVVVFSIEIMSKIK